MTDERGPTETYDGRIRVRLLDDDAGTDEIVCASYSEAVEVVKAHQDVTAAKIVDRNDEVVFTSAEMDIDVWYATWKREKRRLSVSVEAHECPYDEVTCVADDLCVRCTLDKVQEQA